MALSPGTWLNHYEVLGHLGTGGMGEVYRARDNKLQREVALKVLPKAFAQDPERVARFRREAQVLAQLNHVNIAAIHTVEQSGDTHFLVMELASGETLRDRIKRGPVPIEEALDVCKQIAAGLECAHEKPIVHRDLKPANVKVTPEGVVKILDFGLARAFSGDTGSGDPADSPTLTGMTQPGTILGTAAYMSPEQARGKKLDKRTDIWALGCVLFEMLTGKRAFEGEDVQEILAGVMKGEPDWVSLPLTTPHWIRVLLRRCLEKNAKRRLRDAADLQIQIEESLSAPAITAAVLPPLRAKRVSVLGGAGAIIATAAVAGLSVWTWLRPEPSLPVRLTAVHPGTEIVGHNFDTDIAISSDGRYIAYIAGAGVAINQQTGRLYIRALDQLEPKLLAESARSPFFSSDSQWLGFFDPEGLKKVATSGGPAVFIGAVEGNSRGATWGTDDTIVFATNSDATGLFRISAAGGKPQLLTTPDSTNGEADHVNPEFLPGGGGVLFTISSPSSPDASRIAVLDLETGEHKVLIQGGSNPRYAASGHIVYGVSGTLRAVPFDLGTLAVRGAPVPVLEGVVTKQFGAASFSISRDGTLAYLRGVAPGSFQSTLVWVDRDGREEPINAPPRNYVYARLSPDGTRAALDIRGENDIWIWDFARQTMTRLTFDPGFNRSPVWTPDGKRLAFSLERDGSENIFWQAADGSGAPEALTQIPNAAIMPYVFSPDGTQLLYVQVNAPFDISLVRLNGDRQSEPLLHGPYNEDNPVLSPDGRWLAYESTESGRLEIFVRPFPNVNGGRWQVSTEGGTRPLWNPNGRELFYYLPPGIVMSVPFLAGPSFSAGTPQMLFRGEYVTAFNARQYSVSPDGRRFLMIKAVGADSDAPPPQINVVLNWFEELKQRVPSVN